MARGTALFECTACGFESPKWLGRCPSCGGWNSFEAAPQRPRETAGRGPGAEPVSLAAAELTDVPRTATGLPGFDRVLGGGLVPGSIVLLAGEPGVGKSTLLLQTAAACAVAGPVLYVSAEESARQVALRARRLASMHDRVLLLAEGVVEAVIEQSRRVGPVLVVADSVQAMVSDRMPTVAGSVSQVREVAAQLADYAKRGGPPVVLVGHVTKDGTVAGPKSLEHLVDAVVEFSGGSHQPHRVLRSTKNRFGPTLELALYAMTDHGLEEIANPSAALLSDRRTGAAGSAVAVVMEGTSPLLVEVQALVSRSALANPRRVAQGVDPGRLALLLAVLEKRAGVHLGDRDVFVNVVGGIEVDETALDLAVAAAVISSATDRALPPDLALFGEIGLLGEVRSVSNAETRLKEAAALGFARCAVPTATPKYERGIIATVAIDSVAGLRGLLQALPRGDDRAE